MTKVEFLLTMEIETDSETLNRELIRNLITKSVVKSFENLPLKFSNITTEHYGGPTLRPDMLIV